MNTNIYDEQIVDAKVDAKGKWAPKEYSDKDFKNGRVSCALNNYTPRDLVDITGNNLIPKLEGLVLQEDVVISHLQTILRDANNANNPALYARKKFGGVYYSQRVDGREVNITKKPARVLNLLNQELARNSIDFHKNNRKQLQMVINNLKTLEAQRLVSSGYLDFNSRASTLPLRGMQPDFLNWSEEKIRWALEEYATNPFYLEDLQYQTECGLWTRTKSEQRIADGLGDFHLLYRYEPAMTYNGQTKYPDFIIWAESGRIVIWEHRGAQYIDEYRQKEPLLINWYEQQGFSRLVTLIITHEDDVRTAAQIAEIIRRFLLA